MITLKQTIELATEAHKDQWRKPVKVSPVDKHTLENHEITKLQQNNGSDFSVYKEDGEYTMDIHLQLFIAKPYITHPLEVMGMMDTEEEKIVAVLHDVFEQCHNYALSRVMDNSRFYVKNRNSMEEFTVSQTVYDALVALSKYPSDTYEQYIKELSKNKLAVKIKLADMMHNMSESNNPKQKEKYLKTLPILLKAL